MANFREFLENNTIFTEHPVHEYVLSIFVHAKKGERSRKIFLTFLEDANFFVRMDLKYAKIRGIRTRGTGK